MAGQRTDAVFQQFYDPFVNRRASLGSRQQTIQDILARKYLEIALNRFKWKGLPKEISVRWLEMNLHTNALAVFFYDDDFGRYFAMQGQPTGYLNMNGDPTGYTVYGNNYYRNVEKTPDKCVPIWANYVRYPDIDLILLYAQRIGELDRSIEINSKNARRSKVLNVSENMKATMRAITDQIDEGTPAINLMSNMDLADYLKVLDLGVDPQTIISLHMLRTRLQNDFMNYFGINSANQDKKERLVAAEVSGNDDSVDIFRISNLQARQQACDTINDRYGLNVSVEYNTDLKTAELTDVNPETKAIPEGATN